MFVTSPLIRLRRKSVSPIRAAIPRIGVVPGRRAVEASCSPQPMNRERTLDSNYAVDALKPWCRWRSGGRSRLAFGGRGEWRYP